jgi:hypothetical protein
MSPLAELLQMHLEGARDVRPRIPLTFEPLPEPEPAPEQDPGGPLADLDGATSRHQEAASTPAPVVERLREVIREATVERLVSPAPMPADPAALRFAEREAAQAASSTKEPRPAGGNQPSAVPTPRPAVDPPPVPTSTPRIAPAPTPPPANPLRERIERERIVEPPVKRSQSPADLPPAAVDRRGRLEPKLEPAAAPPPVHGPRESKPVPPPVQITIGRIDVRAAPPVRSPAPPPRQIGPQMDLEAYLKSREGGR